VHSRMLTGRVSLRLILLLSSSPIAEIRPERCFKCSTVGLVVMPLLWGYLLWRKTIV
jgi:hypothetical protein